AAVGEPVHAGGVAVDGAAVARQADVVEAVGEEEAFVDRQAEAVPVDVAEVVGVHLGARHGEALGVGQDGGVAVGHEEDPGGEVPDGRPDVAGRAHPGVVVGLGADFTGGAHGVGGQTVGGVAAGGGLG